ncbi:MAG: DUF192 domain-containing protein [Acetobacteraceae bacterium]|nr:MAG: DUF192 domain-containing protein [Acetobacteraceae bacterium]
MSPRLVPLALLALPGAAWAEAACTLARLDLRWDGGHESFAVEVADDNEERARGLMFRTELAPASGMLFVYDSPREPNFWMKNTLIPLDMVFADATGTVTRVHANAMPGDLTPIDGGPGVQFVLEINGGLAAKLGLVPGAELRHPSVPADKAAWSCKG